MGISSVIADVKKKDVTKVCFDKTAVARSFGKAATTYDQHATLQRQTSAQLMQYLPQSINDKKSRLPHVVDLGCGSGAMLEELSHYSQNLVAADLSIEMLQFAQQQHQFDIKQHWLNVDAEALPFMSDSIDLFVSNLALQWCDDLAVPVAEILRCLKPGGYAVFSTVALGSLSEINNAWLGIDTSKHVNTFLSGTQIADAVKQSNAIVETLAIQSHTLFFTDVKAVMQSLKGIGANYVSGKRNRVTTRGELRQFKANYERQEQENRGLPLSYNIAYCVLRKIQ